MALVIWRQATIFLLKFQLEIALYPVLACKWTTSPKAISMVNLCSMHTKSHIIHGPVLLKPNTGCKSHLSPAFTQCVCVWFL